MGDAERELVAKGKVIHRLKQAVGHYKIFVRKLGEIGRRGAHRTLRDRSYTTHRTPCGANAAATRALQLIV